MIQGFDFTFLAANADLILAGIKVTLALITVGAFLGIAVAVACNWLRLIAPFPLRFLVSAYVEFIRNTPFLIQLFFIFFGLPRIGISMSETAAAVLAMSINLGAYGTEILRAGLQATSRGQWEAGMSLGMTRNQTFWRVALLPGLQKIWAPLSSQVVIVMLGSAVVSQIAVTDLTYASNLIQSRTFRAFEIYFVVTAIYILLAALVRLVLQFLGHYLIGTRHLP